LISWSFQRRLDAQKAPVNLPHGRHTDAVAGAMIGPSQISVPTPSPLVVLTHHFHLQVEVLTSLKALSHHVDPSQLPEALEGPFPYCHSEWVQFFQVSALTDFTPDPHSSSSLYSPALWICQPFRFKNSQSFNKHIQ
jgi:hypothetical protein